jgi:hypothetical protein
MSLQVKHRHARHESSRWSPRGGVLAVAVPNTAKSGDCASRRREVVAALRIGTRCARRNDRSDAFLTVSGKDRQPLGQCLRTGDAQVAPSTPVVQTQGRFSEGQDLLRFGWVTRPQGVVQVLILASKFQAETAGQVVPSLWLAADYEPGPHPLDRS